jgi:hypothetical protein
MGGVKESKVTNDVAKKKNWIKKDKKTMRKEKKVEGMVKIKRNVYEQCHTQSW